MKEGQERMERIERIERALVVGAGAIGAGTATLIHKAEPGAVALCATGERRERLARGGYLLNGIRYDLPLADPADGARYGLIIVAVKNHHLAAAIEDIRPYVGPGTAILSLLNGVSSEDVLRAAFPQAYVPLAMIIGTDATREGNAVRLGLHGEIRFGDASNPPGARSAGVSAISDFLARHGVPHAVPEDMRRALWYKFMLNCGLNQWSAVLRADYGVFRESPNARALFVRTMREVIMVTERLDMGLGLGEADIATVLATIDRLGADGKTSMLQDVEARRKTEVEAFAGQVIAMADSAGIDAPLNRALCDAILAIEANYQGRGPEASSPEA